MVRALGSIRVHFNPHTREGCDTNKLYQSKFCTNFNPHTREGCDLAPAGYGDQGSLVISIHTPVKGVTPRRSTARRRGRYFNPHTREGCDVPPRPPRHRPRYFNPHTREGCDAGVVLDGDGEEISIHTPVKGVTLVSSLTVTARRFQSTHP